MFSINFPLPLITVILLYDQMKPILHNYNVLFLVLNTTYNNQQKVKIYLAFVLLLCSTQVHIEMVLFLSWNLTVCKYCYSTNNLKSNTCSHCSLRERENTGIVWSRGHPQPGKALWTCTLANANNCQMKTCSFVITFYMDFSGWM